MTKAAEVYRLLLRDLGPQHWWPADSPFEVIVGALLMPQTSWRNVEKAIGNLKRAGMLSPAAIAASRLDRLRAVVKPAGLYRTKPPRLREFCRHMMRASGGDVDAFLRRDREALRLELLSLKGVGPETADSILLYAAQVKVFVVDTYTRRAGRRLGLFEHEDYDSIQSYFRRNVPDDLYVYQEYHALMVALAKHACRARPRCGACPLLEVCRHGRACSKRA